MGYRCRGKTEAPRERSREENIKGKPGGKHRSGPERKKGRIYQQNVSVLTMSPDAEDRLGKQTDLRASIKKTQSKRSRAWGKYFSNVVENNVNNRYAEFW